MIRYSTALAAVSNKVFAIAGIDPGTWALLSTVSCHDIASDTWECLNSKLNIARHRHSACVLNGTVYVFCGVGNTYGNGSYLNSIYVISETSLIQKSTATWQLIEVPQNILIPREFPAVAPINDTEITIISGLFECKYLSDIISFKTLSK